MRRAYSSAISPIPKCSLAEIDWLLRTMLMNQVTTHCSSIRESELQAHKWLSSARAASTSLACCIRANFFPLMSSLSVSSIKSVASVGSTMDGQFRFSVESAPPPQEIRSCCMLRFPNLANEIFWALKEWIGGKQIEIHNSKKWKSRVNLQSLSI